MNKIRSNFYSKSKTKHLDTSSKVINILLATCQKPNKAVFFKLSKYTAQTTSKYIFLNIFTFRSEKNNTQKYIW